MAAVAEDTDSADIPKEMSELHDQGILTDQEFEQQKRALLSGGQ